MTMPKAVFFGLALIALAVVWNHETVGQQSNNNPGAYMISASDNAGWRIDTRTASVSRCRIEAFTAPPLCSPWSKAR